MSLFKKLFGRKDSPTILDNDSFWSWFMEYEADFYGILKNHTNVRENFVEKVMPRLNQLNPQFYCLAGMLDDTIAELIISAEGDIKTIVFVEELVAAAPTNSRWKFTALKPPLGFKEISIAMDGYEFDSETIQFFSNPLPEYPDEIEVSLVHKDYTEENSMIIVNGTHIFLENSIGELNSVTQIDNLKVIGPLGLTDELIRMEKLPDFLVWREKEFNEKYQGTRHKTENDSYSSLEAEDKEGLPMLAVLNQELMDWDSKASHPWMLVIKISYDGTKTNGMPDEETYAFMNEFEEELTKELPDLDGYLNIGREIYNSVRTIYFACKEFRKSSKSTHMLIENYLEKLDISYEIYKDKYWITMNKFS